MFAHQRSHLGQIPGIGGAHDPADSCPREFQALGGQLRDPPW